MSHLPYRRTPGTPMPAASIFLALLLGFQAAAPVPAEESPWQMVFEGATEVNVVNLEVVVTDSKGQWVGGLTAADFELRENGEPVEISNFYVMERGGAGGSEAGAVAAETAPEPAARPMTLVIYVDGGSLSEINRSKVLARLREFLLDHWNPGMRAMLVSNDGPAAGGSVAIRQGLTSVPHDLFVALEELSTGSSLNPRLDRDRQALLRAIGDLNVEEASGMFTIEQSPAEVSAILGEATSILSQIQLYGEQSLAHVRQTLALLDHFIGSMAGLPGRKALLYVSDGLQMRPGEDLFEAFSRRTEPLAGRMGSQVLSERLDASQHFQALVSRANAERVTFYTLDASPPAGSTRGSAATQASAGGNFGGGGAVDSLHTQSRQESLGMMAAETGGRAGLGLSSLASTLTGVLEDFNFHYSLGYVADRLPPDQQRNLKVEVRGRKGLKVRHRSSLRDKTAAERAADRVLAVLLIDDSADSSIADNPFGVSLETRDLLPQGDDTFTVPVLVKIPLDKLVLVPQETTFQGQVSMFVAVRDDLGRTSQVTHHLCPIRIPNDEVLTALGRSAACGVRLLMRGGPQRVAVSVLDERALTHSTVRLDLDVGAPVDAEAEQASRR